MPPRTRRCTMLAVVASLVALGAAGPASAQDPNGPDGDLDGDGVVNAQDRCPDQAAGGYVGPYAGCPKPKGPDDRADTPVADGPSCTSARPCLVLESKGLGKRQDGTFGDPDATVTVTIARDARGVPARAVDVELSKVDTACTTYGPTGEFVSRTPGPEVSTHLDPLALKGHRTQHANFVSTVFRFDPMDPVRTINGLKHELGFYMGGDDYELFINGAAADQEAGRCILGVHAWLKPVKDPAAERKAVAKCKKMPRATKKQRRARAKCLKNARA